MDLKLKGRTALITGASSGIGRGIARMLAAEGVRLALAGRDSAALETLRAELAAQGCDATVCVGDVSTKEGVEAVASKAREGLGRVDMLVNNAGGSRPLGLPEGAVDAEDEDVWDASFALNFTAARRLAKILAPDMAAAGWGRVINVTGAVIAGQINAATPAKAALQSWSKSLATQLASRGVTVNCVAPGRIHSRQIDENLHPDEASRDAYIRQNIPIGYFGEPEDFASVVTFLLSPLARYVTGTTIHIDGGLLRLAP
jgi:3-oxoacyl-[acyl-carrier protein] reductase